MVKTKNLVIFGGLSCAGKSHWMELLETGQASGLGEVLGVDQPADWQYLNVRELPSLSVPKINNLMVHYDFYADYKNNEFRFLAEVIEQADRVVFVTLCAPSSVLVERLRLRIKNLLKSLFYSKQGYHQLPERLYRLFLKLHRYKDGQTVLRLYQLWYDAIVSYPVEQSWLLDARTGAEPRLTQVNRNDYDRLIRD